MKHYTPKQINEIKQEIRTGKPIAVIADELATRWERPVAGVYTKVLRLSKQTRKIKNTWEGPTRKPYKKRAPKSNIIQKALEFEPLEGSLLAKSIVKEVETAKAVQVTKEICEEIVSKPIEREPAQIGIEVPAGTMSFIGTPAKVVVYADHVRYYFDN